VSCEKARRRKCARLRDQLDDAAGILDLALRLGRYEPRPHDEGRLGQTALAEHLGVSEAEQVEHRRRVLALARQELFALLRGDEAPELWQRVSDARQRTVEVPCRG
jgi:hypothetical protein